MEDVWYVEFPGFIPCLGSYASCLLHGHFSIMSLQRYCLNSELHVTKLTVIPRTDDIQNNWGSVASIAAKAATISQYAAPGGFNDLDMMVCIPLIRGRVLAKTALFLATRQWQAHTE